MGAQRVRFVSGLGLVGSIAAAAVAIVATTAPAGNRDPVPTLIGFPGPGEVTYGQNVAYTSTLPNLQSSTFTHVQFHNPIPTTVSSGQTLNATFKYASCQGTLTATEFVCNEITVPAGQTARVTIVWQTPPAGSSTNCPPTTPNCMAGSATWTIKEGTGNPGSAGPDTFPAPAVFTSLLLVPDPTKAGGYALQTCSNVSNPNLATNQAVGTTNALATAVCASSLPPGDPFNPGLTIEIDEGPGSGPGFTESAEICIPKPNKTCPASPADSFVFSPAATFTFVIPFVAVPAGEKVDLAFHDGLPYSGCTFAKINKDKIWTVTCPATTNGSWRFG